MFLLHATVRFSIQSTLSTVCLAHIVHPPQVELVDPPSGATIGERVTAPGFDGEPDEQLAPKKKVWETVQPDLATDEQRVACYKGVPLATTAGACTAASVVGGSIR